MKARLDDILMTGPNDEVHINTLNQVLTRLEEAGIRLNLQKCNFMQPEVGFCGRIISQDGSRPMERNVKAIKDAPPPTTVTELKSFQGMVNFYHEDLPHLSSILEPLHALLRKNTPWKWSTKEEKAFH